MRRDFSLRLLAIAVLVGVGIAGNAAADGINYLDGWAQFWGVPRTDSWKVPYDRVPADPGLVTATWFETEMKALNERSTGFAFTRSAVVDAANLTGKVLGAPTLGKLGGKLVDDLAAARGEVFNNDRVALLNLYLRAHTFDAGLTKATLRSVLLSKSITHGMSSDDQRLYADAVKEALANITDADVRALEISVRDGSPDLDDDQQAIKDEGGDLKAVVQSQKVLTTKIDVLQHAVTDLRKAQDALRTSIERSNQAGQASALAQIAHTSASLAQDTQLAQQAFQLLGLKKPAEIASKASIAFSTVATAASNLPHNPVGAAIALLGGITSLFGSGRDLWKEDVTNALYEIRRELLEQRQMLAELMQSVRIVAADGLTTKQMLAINQKINEAWFKSLKMDIASLSARLTDAQLQPFFDCSSWATKSAAASAARGMLSCASALASLQNRVQHSDGDIGDWPQILRADASYGAETLAHAIGTDNLQAAVDMSGISAIYREMAWACWTRASCRAELQARLPDEVWRKHKEDFFRAPMLDPRTVAKVVVATNAWFDFYVVCQDPGEAQKALPAFERTNPYGAAKFPTDLSKRCKDFSWKEGVIPQLEVASEITRVAEVQLEILNGDYLADDVVGELMSSARSPAGDQFISVKAPGLTCTAVNPDEEIKHAVDECRSHSGVDCNVLESFARGQELAKEAAAKLVAMLDLESTHLCATATGSRVGCLLDLNRMFAANVGLRWVRARIHARSEPYVATARSVEYGIGYYDASNCSGLWELVACGGVLAGPAIAPADFALSAGWSTSPLKDGVSASRQGQLACEMAAAPADEPSWELRVFDVDKHAGRCSTTSLPLPSPQTVRMDLDFYETADAQRLKTLETDLAQRVMVIDADSKTGTERFARNRWEIYGRYKRLQNLARGH